jgi:ferric-dicitrate binding protein FerR (iron transport regulator)
MAFHHIDERDRENIIRFISLEQLQQLQQNRIKEEGNGFQSTPFAPVDMRRVWRRRLVATAVALAIFAAIAAWLVPVLMDYYSRGSERNIIENTFDQGVQKYRRGSGRE